MIRKEEEDLINQIKKNANNGKVAKANLQTDDRVLARITDGIYRQPASALRELISNADATKVVIQTDAPRFNKITVRDDGHGMDVEALARLIYHIGGSAKRLDEGAKFGISSKKDPSLSPLGRRLIGKIGIGLFSVAQLTRHFQIITKVKNTDYRLIAEVILQTYSEDGAAKLDKKSGKGKIQTGTVEILSVPAVDKESHGTEIILLDLRPQAKDLLKSKEIWTLASQNIENKEKPIGKEPIFHIGRVDFEQDSEIQVPEKLPWAEGDKPEEKFKKLYQAIIDEIGTFEKNPRLERTLDNYLRTLWTLSLSAPVDYIDKHPFDINGGDDIDIYEFSEKSTGRAKLVNLKKNQIVRNRFSFKSPERGNKMPFAVTIDNIELFRPIRFTNLPQTSQALKKPLLFVGKALPDLRKINVKERGGDLSFEAYFMWAPKIVPRENNGLLIRVSDASGTLFDETFAKYQIAELTRLKQITAEIYVIKGLDAALNIDRESFNYAHPHYQYIMRWVHRALRQLTNTHKKLASDIRDTAVQSRHGKQNKKLDQIVDQEISKVNEDEDIETPDVELVNGDKKKILSERKKGKLALDADRIFPPLSSMAGHTKRSKAEIELLNNQVKAIAKVLDAYGLFEKLTYEQQEELLKAIVSIFLVDKLK